MRWLRVREGERKGAVVQFDVAAPSLRVDQRPPKESRPPYWISRYATIPTVYRVRTTDHRWRRVYKLDPMFPRPAALQDVNVLYVVQDGCRALVRINGANRYTMENVGRFD